MRRRPVFALVSALSLAVGVGAGAAVFTTTNAGPDRAQPRVLGDRLGGDPAVLGSTVETNRIPFHVVGNVPDPGRWACSS